METLNNLNKKNISKFFIMILILIFIFISYWLIKVKDKNAYDDVLTKVEDNSAVIPFNEITGFQIISHDVVTHQNVPENTISDLQIKIYSEEGNLIWEHMFEGVSLRGAYFTTIIENMDPPIQVDGGKKYYIKYETTDIVYEKAVFKILGPIKSFDFLYFGFMVMGFLCLGFVLILETRKKEISWGKLAFSLIVSVAVLYNIVMPPLSAPDEVYHFTKAYAVSDRILGTKNENPNLIMVPEDMNNIRYVHVRQTLRTFYNHLFEKEVSNTQEVYNYGRAANAGEYPFFTYLFSGMGITIARLLKLNNEWMMLFGRMGNLLIGAFILAMSIRIIPFGKLAMLSICLFPIVINLVTSYSYDCLNIALTFLFFSLCMYYAYDREKIIWKDIILLFFIIISFIPIKVIYLPMLLLTLFIPMYKYNSKIAYITSNILLWGGGCLSILVMKVNHIFILLGINAKNVAEARNGVTSISENEMTRYTLAWILDNPLYTIKMYVRSLYEYMDSYLMTAAGSLFTDITIPYILTFSIIFLFLILVLCEKEFPEFKWWQKILSVFIMGMCLFCAMTTMLFDFSIFGEGIIRGVNGRYLLPLFPCVFIILKNYTFTVLRDIRYKAVYAMVILNILTLMFIFGDTLRW